MKRKTIILFFGSVVLAGYQHARAQLVVNGTNYTNLGYVSNYDGFTGITAATGSSYNAGSGAVFDHFESNVNTFRVDNPYNANGSGGSTDNFNGPLSAAGTQTVSGSVAPNFSTLVLKNGSASAFDIVNTAGANVFVTADFQNGITSTVRANLAAGALRFQNGATYTGGTSDSQHVNGYVGKVGNTAFTFPVGSGTDSRTLAISAPSVSTASLSTAYEGSNVEDENALATPLQSVFTEGSWDWIAETPTDDDGLAITVSIPDVGGFAIISDLRLVGWNGTRWIDLSGAATATGNAENSTLSGTIPAGVEITQIGIGSLEPPLPVTLVAFTAKAENAVAVLNWSTTTETNSDRFEVERSSNAKDWRLVGTVKSNGESTTLKKYDFVDQAPHGGTNYYRLRMVDFDGTYSFSKIQAVRFPRNDVILHPNPTADQLTILSRDQETFSEIRLVSISGQILMERKGDADKKVEVVDLRGISPGIYLVQTIKADGSITSHRIVKK